MAVHRTKAEALVKWVNSLKLSEGVGNLATLGDGVVFIHIVCRLNGKENELQIVEDKSIEERFQFIFNFLQSADVKESQQDRCRYNPASGSAGSLQKILHGEDIELEMAKVTVLLLHLHTMARQNPREFEDLDIETQGELVGILHFVLDNEEEIHMDNTLATFLQSRALSPMAHHHSTSSDEVTTPMFSGKLGHKTQFVAPKVYSCGPSTSPTSPMRDFMRTPQVQVRRLKRQLADARMLRDDLETELTDTRKLITEKDTHISIMQQKVDRLVRLTERQASEEQPNELGNLQEKCESLLNRLRDTQKQCHELKTEKSQTERKSDKLEEENGDLSCKVRDLGSRLAQSQKALNDLADEHDAAMPLWEEKRTQLQSNLHVALSDKKLMEEKIQILEGKISLMEDQLKEAGEGSSGMRGEVMADVLQVEALKLEVSELTAKATELEQESTFHKEEKGQLTETIDGLKQSISELHEQKERLQLTAQEQAGKLAGQLGTLNTEIMKVNSSLVQKELELEEEKQLRQQVAAESQSRQQDAQQAVHELRSKLEKLGQALRAKEEALHGFERQLEAERESTLQQMNALKRESERICHEKTSVVTQYERLKADKESEMGRLNQQIQVLEGTQLGIEHLEKERNELMYKVEMLDTEVAEVTSKNQSLQSACDAHTQSHSAEVAALCRRLQEAEAELERQRGQAAGLDEALRDIQALREQLAALRGQLDGLESEKQRWEERGAADAQASSRLAQELKGATEEREQAQARLREREAAAVDEGRQSEEKAGELQAQLSAARAALEESGKEGERLRLQEAAWKEKMEAARSEGAALERMVEEARERGRAELAEEKARRSELEARARQREVEEEGSVRLPQSELELMRERAALEPQARAEAAGWQDKLEAAQRLWEEESARNAAVREQERQELARARAESEGLLRCGTRRLAELQEARDAAREAQEARERLQAELTAFQGRLEELKGAESQRLSREEGKREEKERALGMLQEQVSSLQSELASALAGTAQVKAQEETAREQLQKLKEQWRAQEVEMGKLQAQALAAEGELGERIAGQDSELTRHTGLLADRESQLQELGCKLAASEEQCRRHGQEAAAAAEELRSSRHLCQERATDAEALRAQLGELRGKCDSLALRESEAGERFTALKEQLGSLQRERERLAVLQQELQSWQGKCAGEQQESARLREELAAAAESGCRLQEALEKQREAAGLRSEELRAENEAQRQSVESLQQRQTVEEERQCRSDEELERLRAELATAEGQWRAEAERLREEAGQLPAAQQQCTEQAQEVQRLQQALGEEAAKASARLEAELAQAQEAHSQQLQALTSHHTEEEEAGRQREEESRRRVDEVSGKYEKAKIKLMDDRHRFQEEQQQLHTQVADLNQKLSQHDVTAKTKLQKLVARDNEKQEKLEQQMMELNSQLKEKEEVMQHVKAQLDKAKTHYDSKKLLSLELAEKLEAREKSVASLEQQLAAATQEGAEMHAQSERLRAEAQQAVKEAKEANQKSVTLSAQVEYAERQLREVNKSQASVVITRRSRSNTDQGSVQAGDSEAEFSKDSMELSDLDDSALVAWDSTAARRGKAGYKTPEVKRSDSVVVQKLQGKMESLESLYFTPLPQHSHSNMDTSLGSLGSLCLDSAKKTRSGRKRTTQVINILMTKVGGSSPSRSSALYPGGCLDEPDQLDDWNRIAELQRRNGVCPPHLKTSYPLESSAAVTDSAITEDELRLGDPSETLRRATLLPREISAMRMRAFPDTHDPSWKGVTTRQRKRLSEESHQGAGTPEAKKQLSCFPRPASPKGKDKLGQERFESQARRLVQSKGRGQDDRRKSMTYTVFNTPRKLSSSLLRGINKRANPRKTPKKTPKKSPRKSPRSNARKDASRRKFSSGKM
ncbi:nuclear mitotic apparatus protein 1 [Amblyraja radiata]|uniref:nuclear mitotic apparatus protein 1 n=1 Tax=Amblyraja radiata TaxID=386614 RepID=UPI001403C6DD|nr:nuclear mitotic apparatus protein 1 [Amblyraja radiata]